MKLLVSLAVASLAFSPVLAAPCKDAKGKFTKCPPAGTAVAAAGGKIGAPDKNGRCHVVEPAPNTKQKKGQFVSCPK